MSSAIPIVPVMVVAAGQHRRNKQNDQEKRQGFSHFPAPFWPVLQIGAQNPFAPLR
jgi:hypothetical protein